MFFLFHKKYKVLTEKLMLDSIESNELNIFDLLGKNTKVAKLYYLFYFYIRYVYQLVIIYNSRYNKKSFQIQKVIYKSLRQQKKKITRIGKRRLYKQRFFGFYYTYIRRHFYNVIDAIIFYYSSTILNLSSYLEHLDIHKYLRNISKLVILFRRSFKKIHKLSKNQLINLCFQLKKYIWYYKKLILTRIEFHKLNYYIQFILLFSSAKYTLISYISDKLINKKIVNYIMWFTSILTNKISQLFSIMPHTFTKSLLTQSILSSRYLYSKVIGISNNIASSCLNRNYIININPRYSFLTNEEYTKRIRRRKQKITK
jgi:hypothetical protein